MEANTKAMPPWLVALNWNLKYTSMLLLNEQVPEEQLPSEALEEKFTHRQEPWPVDVPLVSDGKVEAMWLGYGKVGLGLAAAEPPDTDWVLAEVRAGAVEPTGGVLGLQTRPLSCTRLT